MKNAYGKPVDDIDVRARDADAVCPICGERISPGRLKSSFGGRAAHLLCVLAQHDKMRRMIVEEK